MVGKSSAYCVQKEVQTGLAARLDIVIQKVSTEGLPCARPGDMRDNNPFICLLTHSFKQLVTEFMGSEIRSESSKLWPKGCSPEGKT